jgi:hypothetical protein
LIQVENSLLISDERSDSLYQRFQTGVGNKPELLLEQLFVIPGPAFRIDISKGILHLVKARATKLKIETKGKKKINSLFITLKNVTNRLSQLRKLQIFYFIFQYIFNILPFQAVQSREIY